MTEKRKAQSRIRDFVLFLAAFGLLCCVASTSRAATRASRFELYLGNIPKLANGVVTAKTRAAFRKGIQDCGHLESIQAILAKEVPAIPCTDFRNADVGCDSGTVGQLAEHVLQNQLSVIPGTQAHAYLSELARKLVAAAEEAENERIARKDAEETARMKRLARRQELRSRAMARVAERSGGSSSSARRSSYSRSSYGRTSYSRSWNSVPTYRWRYYTHRYTVPGGVRTYGYTSPGRTHTYTYTIHR